MAAWPNAEGSNQMRWQSKADALRQGALARILESLTQANEHHEYTKDQAEALLAAQIPKTPEMYSDRPATAARHTSSAQSGFV